MTLFALTLSHDVRFKLQLIVETTFVVFVGFSFICVALYTARQTRLGRMFTSENAPLPLIIHPLSAWLFIACALGLICLQSRLYALVVMIGITGAVVESGSTVRAQFGFDRVPILRAISWGLLIFGAVMLVETPLLNLSDWALDRLHISHPEQQAVESFRKANHFADIVWFLLQAVFIYPVVEELLFRGFLLTFLKNYMSTGMAVVLSAAIFGAAHLNLGSLVPLWFLGLALGIAYQHTGSLLVPISVHACFNLATGLAMLLEKGNPT